MAAIFNFLQGQTTSNGWTSVYTLPAINYATVSILLVNASETSVEVKLRYGGASGYSFLTITLDPASESGGKYTINNKILGNFGNRTLEIYTGSTSTIYYFINVSEEQLQDNIFFEVSHYQFTATGQTSLLSNKGSLTAYISNTLSTSATISVYLNKATNSYPIKYVLGGKEEASGRIILERFIYGQDAIFRVESASSGIEVVVDCFKQTY